MFTGIVEEIGRVGAVQARPGLTRLQVTARRVLDDLAIGDSIAVNGACPDGGSAGGDVLCAEATPETLRRTNLGRLAPGTGYTWSDPWRPTGASGGHIVQGHVDAMGSLAARHRKGIGDRHRQRVSEIMRYVVPEAPSPWMG